MDSMDALEVLLRFNQTVRDTIYEPPFEVLRVSETPRFGHTDDITSIVGSKSETRDYVAGLIFGAAIIFAIFLLWFVTVITFKCLGKERFGFLSGAPFDGVPELRKDLPAEAPRPQGADQWDDELQKEYHKLQYKSRINPSWRNRPTRLRLLFLSCGIVYVVFSVLLVTKGVANLFQTLDVFQRSLDKTNAMANSTSVILGELQPVALAAGKVYDGLSSEITGENFCPNDPTLSFSTEAQNLQSQAQDAVDRLGEIKEIFNTTLLSDLQAVLDQYYSFATPLDEALNKVDVNDWRVIIAIVPIDVVAVLMMVGALMALFTIDFPFYATLLDYVLCPLMFLICAVCWMVAGLMAMAAGLNGDFCLPGGRYEQSSPDDTILELMNATGNGPTDEKFDPYTVAAYFVLQCTVGVNPFEFVSAAVPKLLAGQEVLMGLDGIFNNTDQLNLLSLYCGRDFATIETALTRFVDLVSYLLAAAIGVLDLVSCRMLVPLYVNTVYEGMCTYSPAAVYWVFKCAIVMAFMSSIMLTIRSSYMMTRIVYPSEVEDDDALDAEVSQTEDDAQERRSPTKNEE